MLIVLKNYLKLCGLYRFERVQCSSPRLYQTVANLFAIGTMGFFCTSSIIYSLNYQDMINVIKSAGYSYNNILTICVTYVYLLITRTELWTLFEAWEETIRNRINRCPTTLAHYQSRKELITHLLRRIRFITPYVFMTYFIFGVLVPIGYLVMGNYDPETWVIIYDQFLVPFSADPYAKYFGISICLGCVAIWYGSLTTLYPTLMIGSCMCFEACIDDLIYTLKEISDVITETKLKQEQEHELEQQRGKFFDSSFVEIIQYQIECISCLKNMGKYLSFVLFWNIMNSVTAMSVSLFLFAEDLDNIRNNRIINVVPLTVFVVLAFSVYIYCYYGSRVTIKPKQLSQSFYELPWYLLPIQRQKEISLMLTYGRFEIYYSGYGIITCSLETFSHIMNRVWKFFLILRSVL